MARRVVDQHAGDLADARLVADRHRGDRRHADRGTALGRDRREVACDALGNRFQLDRLVLQRHLAGIETREIEQVGREPSETVDLVFHRREELRAHRLVVLVEQQLEKAREREDGGTQLV